MSSYQRIYSKFYSDVSKKKYLLPPDFNFCRPDSKVELNLNYGCCLNVKKRNTEGVYFRTHGVKYKQNRKSTASAVPLFQNPKSSSSWRPFHIDGESSVEPLFAVNKSEMSLLLFRMFTMEEGYVDIIRTSSWNLYSNYSSNRYSVLCFKV
jgi:hypothetical protein